MNLPARLRITRAHSHIVCDEMALQRSRAEADGRALLSLFVCAAFSLIITVLLCDAWAQIGLCVQYPSVGGACVEKGSDFLRRISNINLGYVRVVG